MTSPPFPLPQGEVADPPWRSARRADEGNIDDEIKSATPGIPVSIWRLRRQIETGMIMVDSPTWGYTDTRLCSVGSPQALGCRSSAARAFPKSVFIVSGTALAAGNIGNAPAASAKAAQ